MNLTPDDPKLTAYALGELDAGERAAVEAALARSPECRRAVDEIRALGGKLTTALAADAATARDALPTLPTLTEGADAPSEGKVIFLPWRQWRTVGLAAAAAVAMGFIVAKFWQPDLPHQTAQHRVTERVPAAAPVPSSNVVPQLATGPTPAQRPTNQVAQGAIVVGRVVATNGPVIGTGADGLSDAVSVSFVTVVDDTAVAGVDFITPKRVLTFARAEPLKAYSVQPLGGAAPSQGLYYRSVAPSSTNMGFAIAGLPPGSAPEGTGERHWHFARPDLTTTAAYPRYVENPFTLVASEPLSTVSTDVDTASYANVRRFLSQNQLPPRDAVRIEELLNYFSYAYAPPTGEHPFAAHIEVAGCPWTPEHRLVRVGLKGRELKQDKRPASNFVFLIDVSGSMSPATRLPLIKQSLRQLVKRMTKNDRVAMVVYASSSGTVLESTSAVNKEVILSAIDRLEAGGSTNGGEGIQRAYDLAVANFIKGGVNRVLLCTDGDFNVGITDRGQLLKLIEERAKSGVFLTTLGVGDDNFKDATLQQLADKGNGNYHYLDSVEEGHKVLVEQMNATLVTIAKDVKIQIEFNPAQAAAYRLIGYEKRILAKEDFNNDAKDAGEIGAGHTVTVLYEIVPAGVPVRGAVDPLKYQPNGQPTDLAAKGGKELEAERAKLEAAVANSAEVFKPNHPKMLELVSQLEELNKKLGLAKGRAISKELLTLKLRYKAPDGDKSTLMEIPVLDSRAPFARASTDFKFASAVAEFGMLLKDSPFKGTATFDSALEHAREGKGDDTHGYRAEFINLVAKAKALKP